MKQAILTIAILCLLTLPAVLLSQDKPESPQTQKQQQAEKRSSQRFIGFEDEDHDGVNDKFYDANGDGTNDVDDQNYAHRFKFEDKNNDKINDMWVDRDGDGVNDLINKLSAEQRRDRNNNVLDVNEDGRNDITGEQFDPDKPDWKGEKWGFWNETEGKLQGPIIDENGDGIDDRVKDFNGFMSSHGKGRKRDLFIDEDGDGICDHRTDFINRMGRHGHRGGRQGGKDNKGHH